MKVSELASNPRNPRKIDYWHAEALKKSLQEFGDLSGIVYNINTKQLVGGHQRCKAISPESEIQYLEQFDKPTQVGTVATGFITIDGEKYSYREVAWSKKKEQAANIAANKHGGQWDYGVLTEQLLELDQENYDMWLTGFDAKELENILAPAIPMPAPEPQPKEPSAPQMLCCPECGATFTKDQAKEPNDSPEID